MAQPFSRKPYDYDRDAFVLPHGDYAYWQFVPELNIWTVKLEGEWWFVPGTVDGSKVLFAGLVPWPVELTYHGA